MGGGFDLEHSERIPWADLCVSAVAHRDAVRPTMASQAPAVHGSAVNARVEWQLFRD